MTENVVYGFDPQLDPPIKYRSVPSSCVGEASNLQDARARYRADLAQVLGARRQDLPPVVEHIEAAVAGMRVRTRIGAVHRDPANDRMFVQTLLAPGPAQDALRAHLETAATVGVEPVVVVAEPDETLGAVLDQMSRRDALWVAHRDGQGTIGWFAIYGPDASAPTEHTPAVVDAAALRNVPVYAVTGDGSSDQRASMRATRITREG